MNPGTGVRAARAALAATVAIYLAQLGRARLGGGAVIVVAALQSVGTVVLLRGTAAGAAAPEAAAMVAGSTVVVVAFVGLNLLAQRFAGLVRHGGLTYFATLPVPASAVVLGVAGSYVTFAVPGAVLTALVGGAVFALPLGPLWMLVPVLVAAGAAFGGLGALIGLAARRSDTATLLGQLGLVVVFFVGVVPPTSLPDAIRPLRAALPFAWDVDALAGVFAPDPAWSWIAVRLAVSLAFGAGCLAVAASCYRRAVRR